jgi:hypothetical protein
MQARSLFTAALMTLGPVVAHAQQPSSIDPRREQPIVKLGLFAIKPDGTPSSAAYATSDFDFGHDNQVYVSPCGMGASGVPGQAPALTFAVWRVRGQVLRFDERMARVRVTWQRVRAGGRAVNEPETTIDVTLTPADPTTLDEVVMPETGECKAMDVRLQARYEPRMMAPLRMTLAGKAVGSVSSAGAGGSVAQVASAGGAIATAAAAEARGGVTRTPSNGFSFVGAGGTRGFTGYQRAELWLVHSIPNRPDEVLMTSTIATTTVGDFAFAPVAVQTSTGLITVRVTGTVELGRDANGTPKLVFGARRRTSFVPASRQPRDGEASVEAGGVASTVVAVPGPEEVLSFEMPPLQGAGLPTVPDGFAIRLRLSPVTTPVAR